MQDGPAADMSDQRWAQRASADQGPEESVVGTWRPTAHSGSPVLSGPPVGLSHLSAQAPSLFHSS